MDTNLISEEQSLQEGVHVACRPLILQAYISGVLLRIPADSVGGLGIDVDFQSDAVFLAVAPVDVKNIAPVHEVTEAPVVFFAEEEVLDLPREILHTLFLSQDPQVCDSIARPGG